MKLFEIGKILRKNVAVTKQALQQTGIEQSRKTKKCKSSIEKVSSSKVAKVESGRVTSSIKKKKKKKSKWKSS